MWTLRRLHFTGTPIRDPSLQEVQSLIYDAFLFFNFAEIFPAFAPLSPDNVEVIIDVRNQNLERSKVSGFDVSASYSSALGSGTLNLFLNGTFIDKFEQQVAPALPVEDRLNSFGQPNSVRMRAGVQWVAPALMVGLFINHTGDYEDTRTTEQFTIDSWTTVDGSIQLNLNELDDSGMLDDAQLLMSIRNVFNEDPPDVADVPFAGSLFDAANADPFGRRLGITLTKKW